ncbi:MAG: LamG domain-containing protein [Anaerolineae bacterium]|nr:LamG domain-containing protein [Anaerolineae bacterium]
MHKYHLALLLGLLGMLACPLSLQVGLHFEDNAPSIALADGLVAYYPFDGSAHDASGNGYHGVVFGAVLTTDRRGEVDQAYLFDGMDDYIALPDHLDVIDTTFTVSAWIKPYDYGALSLTSSSCARKVLAYRSRNHANGDPINSGMSVSLNENADCNGPPSLRMSFIGTDYHYNGLQYDFGVTHEWMLYTVTREPDRVFLYLNGQLMAENEVSSLPVYENPAHPLTTIGAHRAQGLFMFPFEGAIDDVRLYDRALSPAEVRALYQE